jgi:hypothetical protein
MIVFQLLQVLIHFVQPILVPICFLSAWSLSFLVCWSLWNAIQDGAATAQKMHQIPCSGCQFFTNDYRLKCTVRPSIANTEDAVSCMDYQPKTNSMFY